MSEPDITINGCKLTEAQAMTVRVALVTFALDLREPDALGKDYTGRGIRKGYKARVSEILTMISTSEHR